MARGKKTGEGLGPLSNEDTQVKKRKRQQIELDFKRADLEAVLLAPEGRRFFYRLVFEVCALHNPSFDLQIKDGVAMGNIAAFEDGRRAVGSALAADVQQYFPELWVQMVKEELARIAAEALERETNQSAGD